MNIAREESINLLAHSLRCIAENAAMRTRSQHHALQVGVDPEHDFRAEAERMYEAELNRLVMERCNEVIKARRGGA